jgi:hypothetical protein
VVEAVPRTGALSRVESTSAAIEDRLGAVGASGMWSAWWHGAKAPRGLGLLPGSPAIYQPTKSSNVSCATRLGSQTPSQRRQAPGHTKRRRTMVSEGRPGASEGARVERRPDVYVLLPNLLYLDRKIIDIAAGVCARG